MECDSTNCEPAFRNRSNTWPRKSELGNVTDKSELENVTIKTELESVIEDEKNRKRSVFLGRRNIYGEYSYSDLITKAINSSPEKKLSLSEIYDWMIENVPVLRGRPEGMASWKNSVRHNLSLHSKFVRIQNKNAGKCSYWTIDPDAKPKPSRRRAGSMESNKLESKRQRAKKYSQNFGHPQAEAVNTTSAYVLPGFQISPAFRARTWSNDSSCSRLSPIPSEEILVNIPNERLDMPVRYYQRYQCDNQFRPRSYSSGSSGGKISPEYPEQMRRYYTKPSTVPSNSCTYNETSSPHPYFEENQYEDDGNFQALTNTFQYNMTIETPQISNHIGDSSNFYQQIDTGYQYAMNIIHSQVRPQSLDLNANGVQDVDNIQVDMLKSPLQCNVEEIISQELQMGESFDFN